MVVSEMARAIKNVFLLPPSDVYGGGILVSYEKGEKCPNNSSLYFTLQMLFSCSEKPKSPRVVAEKDCLFVVEWQSKSFCPLCKKNQLGFHESACKSGSKTFYYKESNVCSIFPISKEQVEEVPILEDTEEFELVRNLVKPGKESITSKLEALKNLIEHQVTEESCHVIENVDWTLIVTTYLSIVALILVVLMVVFLRGKNKEMEDEIAKEQKRPIAYEIQDFDAETKITN